MNIFLIYRLRLTLSLQTRYNIINISTYSMLWFKFMFGLKKLKPVWFLFLFVIKLMCLTFAKSVWNFIATSFVQDCSILSGGLAVTLCLAYQISMLYQKKIISSLNSTKIGWKNQRKSWRKRRNPSSTTEVRYTIH